MGNMFYLLNIKVSGIKNIKKEIQINFYKKTVDRNFDPDRYRVKAIYGENGAGKSALITAVKIFQDLLINDNYLHEFKTQVFLDEIINKVTQEFKFTCEFLVDLGTSKSVYMYSVKLGKNDNGLYEIKSETLKTRSGNYANNKYKTVYECKDGELVYINCSGAHRKIIEKKTANLLSANPLVYMYITKIQKELENTEIIDKELLLHMIMPSTLVIIISVYLEEEDQHELYFLKKRMQDSQLGDQKMQHRLLRYVEEFRNLSLKVTEKSIEKKKLDQYRQKVEQLTQFIRIFKPDLMSIDIDAKENGEFYECELNLNYGDYSINKEFESTGIKKLIRLFDCFMAASTSGIVFIDEMDSNLNDVYLCKLIEYFMYYGQGQLCFTTHNLDPMVVLKENRNSIDFLSTDNHLVPWVSKGNAAPDNYYRNGMIEDSPFNIDATDFVGIFGE